MADVRCPMCSKLNPADRDTCQYCDARLKPLLAGNPETPQTPPAGNDESDWLSGLRSDGGDDFGQDEPASSEDLGADDWLARLSGSEPEPPKDEFGEEIEENTLPDWFTDSGTSGSESQGLKDIHHSEELPSEEDWFTLSAETDSPESLPEAEPAAEPELESAAEEPLFAEDTPEQDFFAGPSEETAPSDWPSLQSDQQPWESAAAEAGEPDLSAPAEDEVAGEPAPSLDWFTAEPEKPAEPQEFDSQTFGSGEVTQPAFSSEEELSDWSTDSGDSGLPAWLTSNRAEPAAPGEQPAEPEVPGEEPEWLRRVRLRQRSEQQTKELDDTEIEEPTAAPELPDWLSSFSSSQPENLEPEAPPPAGTPSSPVVSPFTSLEGDGQEAFAWSSGGLGQTGKPGQTPPAKNEIDDTPDWLKSLHKAQEDDESEAASAFEDEAAPDWLSRLGTPREPGTGSSVPAFVLDESDVLPPQDIEPFPGAGAEETLEGMPDWLAQVRDEQEQSPEQPSEAETGEELARANLPTWLEAMRPVEAVAPEMFKDTSDARVENAGPLAGLRGALPAEVSFKEAHKPAIYSHRLSVPEEQTARLAILKSLLADETQPKPLPAPAALSSQLLVRVLVFLVFAAMAVYTLWAGPQAATQLSSIQSTQPVIDFQSHLASIQPGSPVLVAFDFEPGFTTEMDASLEAVLNQLAALNGPVFTVSTSTSGAILAERLMANVTSPAEQLQTPFTGLKNLGFLPGGPAGLLSFVADPAHTIPLDIRNGRPWLEIGQEGNANLAKFATIIVATDQAETARMWIEQISPGLQKNGTSLLMVTSAQVEPLVNAYYTAAPQMVNGFISGLAGGATYENLVGLPGAASAALDAFSGVLLVGLLAILVGGLVSGMIGITPSKPEPKSTIEEKA